MSKKRFSSVWDAIEDSASEAASMKLRAQLAIDIVERLRKSKLTQAKAAELIGVSQPRISDLMRGRLDLFSLDVLVDMADKVGLRTRMVVSAKRATRGGDGTCPAGAQEPASARGMSASNGGRR